MLELRCETSPRWTAAVLEDFGAFLVDHAACERKAAATAMAFVVRYPDRAALIEPMVELAREELEHFGQVYRLIAARGLTLGADAKDPYVNPLIREVRAGRDPRLLDRLLLGGIVEARGCERFGLVAAAIAEDVRFGDDERALYAELYRAEARHHGLFVRLAREYFADDVVRARLDELLVLEAEVVAALPIRAALH